MRVAILAGGVEPDLEFCLAALQAADRVICADGGFALALQLGWVPDLVVGDLDSLGSEELHQLHRLGIPLQQSPPEKDQSDLELAIQAAAAWGATEVHLLGALGGRTDHMLFNLVACLSYCHRLGLPAHVLSSHTEARLVVDRWDISGRGGWLCSLLSLSEETVEVHLEGFLYPLAGETLHRHSSRGLSNRIQSDPARIRIRSGLLLAVLTPPGA
ncbi:MAG: thiamine diphosphokinase [Candidatus Eremiobacterota bacterium]